MYILVWHVVMTRALSSPCRGGLNSRSQPSDQLQINIDPGQQFNYDKQLSDLRHDVKRIKQVRSLFVTPPCESDEGSRRQGLLPHLVDPSFPRHWVAFLMCTCEWRLSCPHCLRTPCGSL